MATKNGWTLSELANFLDGKINGPGELQLESPVPAGSDNPLGITFAESEKFLKIVETSQVGAVIISHTIRDSHKPSIRVENPRLAFFKLLTLAERDSNNFVGIHPTAIISPNANIHPFTNIGPYVVIEDAEIEEGAQIYAFCYIGSRCKIGKNATLYPHVVLYEGTTLLDNCIVHSGTVLGADGFGYFWDGNKHQKIPQIGLVHIEENVEIGANSCIDRSTCGQTIIGAGTKIDNLVQVAHNVQIGQDNIIAGQTGIAGSSKIGNRVILGGQVAINDHISIADDITLGGCSGVSEDLKEPGSYWGLPAIKAREAMQIVALQKRLPELFKRLKNLELNLVKRKER